MPDSGIGRLYSGGHSINFATPLKKREGYLWVFLAAIMIAGLVVNWRTSTSIPVSDPLEYPLLAAKSHFFYDTAPREPLHIFLLKGILPFFSQTETALRFFSVIFTFLTFLLLCLLARVRFGWLASVLIAVSYAANGPVLIYSNLGFNMVTYIFFLMVFFYFWDHPSKKTSLPFLGFLVALVALTRLEGLFVAGICLGAEGFLRLREEGKASLPPFFVSLGIVFVLVFPYLLVQKMQFGSFLHSHQGHATFWFNRELLANVGFNESAVVLSREPMSMAAFIFRDGVASGLIEFTKGWLLAFSWYLPRLFAGSPWFWITVPLGIFAAFKRKSWRIMFLWGACVVPVAPILTLDQVWIGSGAETRFLLQTIPLLCVLSGLGVDFLVRNKKELN